MKVIVDDLRRPLKGWIIANSYKRAIQLLKTGKVKQLSLDHDLGEGKTGYDIAKWIEEQVITNNFIPPKIFTHSQNPVGRAAIQRCIEKIKALSPVEDI